MRYLKIGAVLTAIAIAALALNGCTSATAGTVRVTEAAVEETQLEPVITLEGVLLPAETAVVSSRISGQVASVAAKAGDTVQAGQVLATLDDKALKAQLQQAEAGLKTARAAVDMAGGQAEVASITLKSAEVNFERVKALNASGAASQSQLDDAADKLNTARIQAKNAAGPAGSQAEASVATAQASIENLKAQLGYTQLVSPIDGIVTTRSTELGETVSPGTAVLTVARLDTLRIKGVVSQDMLPFLTVGKPVTVVTATYPDTPLEGKLTVVGPTAVNTGELFPVEIEIANDGRLMAGMTATASLKAEGRKGLTVPEAALVQESGKRYVYVLKDGTAHKTEVTAGRTQNGRTEILTGLQSGDTVASAGAGSLRDGVAVTVQP